MTLLIRDSLNNKKVGVRSIRKESCVGETGSQGLMKCSYANGIHDQWWIKNAGWHNFLTKTTHNLSYSSIIIGLSYVFFIEFILNFISSVSELTFISIVKTSLSW